jgi:uncharacterized lipoprotein YajG
MTYSALAIIVALFVFAGCAEPIQPTQAMSDEQRCVNSGGMWRANSFCEQPGGGRGRR